MNAAEIGSFAANEVVVVDGWVPAEVAYPTDGAPWNSDSWFHLGRQPGRVGFAGVRGTPTAYDPTGLAADGGRPAPR